jgi:branched-subunit amino acid aminotransferase/4-amino-4-deoxychorismate lyase
MRKTSRAFLYGCGVFSTIRVLNGLPFLWEKHWRRLADNATRLRIDLSEHSEPKTRHALDEIIETERVSQGKARITFADESPSDIWTNESAKETVVSIVTSELRTLPDDFRLTISPYHVNLHSPLLGIKSCNYLDKIISLKEAKARGFDEAIQLNERREVTSAAAANIFWLRDNILCTPSLKTGCLPGTTREFVLENLECREIEVAVDTLDSAEAIFLTSAGLGIVQVAEFESRRFEKIRHPILELVPTRA